MDGLAEGNRYLKEHRREAEDGQGEGMSGWVWDMG